MDILKSEGFLGISFAKCYKKYYLFIFLCKYLHSHPHLPKPLSISTTTRDRSLVLFVEGRCVTTELPVNWQSEKINNFIMINTINKQNKQKRYFYIFSFYKLQFSLYYQNLLATFSSSAIFCKYHDITGNPSFHVNITTLLCYIQNIADICDSNPNFD